RCSTARAARRSSRSTAASIITMSPAWLPPALVSSSPVRRSFTRRTPNRPHASSRPQPPGDSPRRWHHEPEAPGSVTAPQTVSRIRVRYADTDQMGIVYYANYFVWFEVGRTDLLRSGGWSYREMEADGFSLPVIDA